MLSIVMATSSYSTTHSRDPQEPSSRLRKNSYGRADAKTVVLTKDLGELKGTLTYIRFLYFIQGLTTSTWGRFGVIYYICRGLSADEIGLIEGVMPFVQAASTLFWGYVADLTKMKKTVLFITRILSACILVMLAFKYLARDFIHIFLISVGSQAFTSESTIDAFSLDMLGDHAKLMYGRVRLWAAFSWGFGAFGMSWITQYYGFDWNFIIYGSLAAMSAYPIIRLTPSKTIVEEAMGNNIPDRREAFNALFNVRVICFFMEMYIMGVGIGVVEKLLFVYLMDDLGASIVLCGSSVLMTTLFELPLFYWMYWLNTNLGYDTLAMISQTCYVFRVWGYTFLTSKTKSYILLIEILHGFTFATLWCGAKEYQRSITPLGWQGLFSSLLWMFYGCLGKGTGSIVGGFLFDNIGAKATYKGASGLVSCLLLIRLACYCSSMMSRCLENSFYNKYLIQHKILV